MRQKRKAKILLALFFIAIPNINIVDLLPDFIAYIILFRMIKPTTLAIPYMHETKNTLKRLAFLSLAKIPAFVVMIANMHTGRDIVPLFTLVFGVIEAILLYSLVTDLFAGLFYIAERTDTKALTDPLELQTMKITSDGIKMLTLTFLMAKCVFNVIPEFCLLTTFNPKIIRFTNGLYPPLLLFLFIASLVFGIMWFNVARKYVKRIRKEADLTKAIESMLGDEKIEKIKNDMYIESVAFPLSLLSIASIFTIDFTFTGEKGINLLPHFIYGILLCIAIFRMSSSRFLKKAIAFTSGIYTALSAVAYGFSIEFLRKYRMQDLATDPVTQKQYGYIQIFSLLETIVFTVMIVIASVVFRRYIIDHTGISPKRLSYGKIERDYHKLSIIRGFILFGITLLINVVKCIKIYLERHVNIIFSHSGNIIVTSALPWLGWVTLGMSVGLIFYSFIYLSSVKADVRFKYDKEETDTRRGVFE